MRACEAFNLQVARVPFENGASISAPHRGFGWTAGHFLARKFQLNKPLAPRDSELCAMLWQAGFDNTNAINSRCRCSPGGFTPTIAIGRCFRRVKFRSFISCLGWPTDAVEKQVRAIALAETFDQLGMTHTCANPYKKLQILEEDRLEIESEEEYFNNQLQDWMKEYDILRVKFSGGPLEFLDYFFELYDHELMDPRYPWHVWWTSYDKDILGPGIQYQCFRESFTGRKIIFGPTEGVKEENMLSLLFDEGQ